MLKKFLFVVLTLILSICAYFFNKSSILNGIKKFQLSEYRNYDLDFLLELKGGIKLGDTKQEDSPAKHLHTSLKGEFHITELKENVFYWHVNEISSQLPLGLIATGQELIFQDFILDRKDYKLFFGTNDVINYETWLMQNYQRWIVRMMDPCYGSAQDNISYEYQFPNKVLVKCVKMSIDANNVQKLEEMKVTYSKNFWSARPTYIQIVVDEQVVSGSFSGSKQRTTGYYKFLDYKKKKIDKIDVDDNMHWGSIDQQPMPEQVKNEINTQQALGINLLQAFDDFINVEELTPEIAHSIKYLLKYRWGEVEEKVLNIFKNERTLKSKQMITILASVSNDVCDKFIIETLKFKKIKKDSQMKVFILSAFGLSESLSETKINYFKNTKLDFKQIAKDQINYIFWLMRANLARNLKTKNLKTANSLMKPIYDVSLKKQDKKIIPSLVRIIGNSGLEMFVDEIISLFDSKEFNFVAYDLLLSLRFMDKQEAFLTLMRVVKPGIDTYKIVMTALQMRIDAKVPLHPDFVKILKQEVLPQNYPEDFKEWVKYLN